MVSARCGSIACCKARTPSAAVISAARCGLCRLAARFPVATAAPYAEVGWSVNQLSVALRGPAGQAGRRYRGVAAQSAVAGHKPHRRGRRRKSDCPHPRSALSVALSVRVQALPSTDAAEAADLVKFQTERLQELKAKRDADRQHARYEATAMIRQAAHETYRQPGIEGDPESYANGSIAMATGLNPSCWRRTSCGSGPNCSPDDPLLPSAT